MDEDSIQQYLDSINDSIETIRQNTQTLNGAEIPSDFKLSMMGAKDSRILNIIYDTKLDYAIDKMLNKIMSGDFEDVERYADTIKKIFNNLGLGDNAFQGPVSQLLMNNMMKSMNSLDFNSTTTKIKRVMLILKNLKKQAKYIDDKEQKKKYIAAVKSFKSVLKIIAKVYRNREIVSNRILKGLNYAVNEEIDIDEPLESL